MKHLKLLFYALALSATFASCGGGDDDEPSVPGSSSEQSSGGSGSGSGSGPSGSVANTNANSVSLIPELGRMEFPHVKGGTSIVLVHKIADHSYDKDGVNICIEWDTQKKSQRWTCYQMHKGFGGNSGRSDDFKEDPDLPSTARVSDSHSMFSGSGYTRGHICPSADRTFSKDANQQTFYYTNMQPQTYAFNGGNNYDGVWLLMENKVRQWANQRATDTLFVCKGGTIDNPEQLLPSIKKNGEEMLVPKYFFMALLCKTTAGEYRAMGFWSEHLNYVPAATDLRDYVVSIDELEELTGIDFFCNLPDYIEKEVENRPKEKIINAWGL